MGHSEESGVIRVLNVFLSFSKLSPGDDYQYTYFLILLTIFLILYILYCVYVYSIRMYVQFERELNRFL